ncbi:MAG: type IV pilin protein [Rhodanobacter sp.]
MPRAGGFTLLELMIVVAIVAILAAIAVPSYGRYAFRAHRADGQELLLRIANAQERFYATNNRYGTLTEMGYDTPAMSEKGYYSVTSGPVGGDTQTFLLQATPVGAQATDVCGILSIDNSGHKVPLTTDVALNSNGSCW